MLCHRARLYTRAAWPFRIARRVGGRRPGPYSAGAGRVPDHPAGWTAAPPCNRWSTVGDGLKAEADIAAITRRWPNADAGKRLARGPIRRRKWPLARRFLRRMICRL